MKKCTKCKELKVLSEFHIKSSSKDGHKSVCKECVVHYMRHYVMNNKERINSSRRKTPPPLANDELRVCTSCYIGKPTSDFHTQKDRCSGLRSRCKVCRNKNNVKARSSSAAKKKASEYRQKYLSKPENIERKRISSIKYRVLNKNKIKEKNRNYLINNRYKCNSTVAKRRAKKLKATPKWLTKNHLTEIRKIYKLAHEIRWLNEEPLHVDHIAPLQGKTVCGLHVPWNLQILTASSNIGKGNRLNP